MGAQARRQHPGEDAWLIVRKKPAKEPKPRKLIKLVNSIKNEIATTRLRQVLRDRRTCFFLGAGASRSCGLPLGDQAVREIANAIMNVAGVAKLWKPLFEQLDSDPDRYRAYGAWPRFEVIVSLMARHLPDSPRVILGLFKNHGRSSCQAMLAKASSHPKIWLTTNFDDQIELALQEHGPKVAVNRRDFSRVALGAGQLVLKLHGDDTSKRLAQDTVATIERLLLAFPGLTRNRLVARLRGRPLVFVGYAARDPDLTQLLRELIAASPSIVWVGKDEMPARVKALLKGHSDAYFLANGFDEAIARPLRFGAIEAEPCTGKWSRQLEEWAASQSSKDPQNVERMQRFLVDLALAMNTSESRRIADRLLDAAYQREPLSARRFSCQMDVLFRDSPRPMRRIRSLLRAQTRRWTRNDSDAAESVNRLTQLASAYQRLGDYTEARRLFVRALASFERVNDFRTKYELLSALGKFATFFGGKLRSEAGDFLKQAWGLAASEKEMLAMADAIKNVAVFLMRDDDAFRAERYLRKYRKLEEEIGDPVRLGSWQLNLAEACRIQRKFKSAYSELEKARLFADASGDFEQQVKVLTNTGLTAVGAGDVGHASRCFADALKLIGNAATDEVAGNIWYNQGWIRLLAGEWRASAHHFRKAYRAYLEFGGPERAAGALACAGWCDLELGDKAAAKTKARKIQFLRPRETGLFAPEITLLSLALGAKSTSQFSRRLLIKLRGHHEQLFRGVALLYSNKCWDLTASKRRHYARTVVSAALASKLPLLCARATALLQTETKPDELLNRLKAVRHRPLADYLRELTLG